MYELDLIVDSRSRGDSDLEEGRIGSEMSRFGKNPAGDGVYRLVEVEGMEVR